MNNSNSIQTKIELLEKQRSDLAIRQHKNWGYHLLAPIIVFITSLFIFGTSPAILIITAGSILASIGIHFNSYNAPFNQIKTQVREELLSSFMQTYHPDIKYRYYADKRNGDRIIKNADLISADEYEEEDVLVGEREHIQFYLSEIKLKNESNDSTTTVFEGLLFKIKIAGASFPDARIQSETGLLNRIFGSFMKNEEFGFWYNTNQPAAFNEKMKSLFRFIKYLKEKQGDLRIRTSGDEITILLESEMKFLDDPKPSLHKSFLDKSYYKNMTKQLNSLLFIIESFVDELDSKEIEEKLELKALEYAELEKKNTR